MLQGRLPSRSPAAGGPPSAQTAKGNATSTIGRVLFIAMLVVFGVTLFMTCIWMLHLDSIFASSSSSSSLNPSTSSSSLTSLQDKTSTDASPKSSVMSTASPSPEPAATQQVDQAAEWRAMRRREVIAQILIQAKIRGGAYRNRKASASTGETSSTQLTQVGRNITQAQLVDNAAATHTPSPTPPSFVYDDVHMFYYPWYQTPEIDGQWSHWNHQYLSHWTPSTNARFPQIGHHHSPPADIGSTFYPALGAYSSNDPKVIEKHMQDVVAHRVPVLAISWWGREQGEKTKAHADGEGVGTDHLFPQLLQIAAKQNVKISFHMEPYKDRNALTTKQDIQYIVDKYGQYPSFYRTSDNASKHTKKNVMLSKYVKDFNKPLYYIYDSYHTSAHEWAEILCPNGKHSIRGTKYDGLFISLYLNEQSQPLITDGCFDGFYTYFASVGFTVGSTPSSWRRLSEWARANQLIFIPSVGPGYDDTQVRPWNGENTKPRNHGDYYRQMWQQAIDADVPVISVTSYNEWHEGTNVEAAIPYTRPATPYGPAKPYADYAPQSTNFYMELTQEWAQKFRDRNKKP